MINGFVVTSFSLLSRSQCSWFSFYVMRVTQNSPVHKRERERDRQRDREREQEEGVGELVCVCMCVGVCVC